MIKNLKIMLRKVLLLVFSTILLTSCGIDHTDFSGNWIDKKNERDRMIIKKNGDNYIVENRGKKYPAQIKDGLLEISTELPIKATIDDNDILIISGKEYIRFKKSNRFPFVGKWETAYFYKNGKNKSEFIGKTGVKGYIVITPDLKVEYQDFETHEGEKIDANYEIKSLFGNLSRLYLEKENGVLRNNSNIILSITEDNYLKISYLDDTDFVTLRRIN